MNKEIWARQSKGLQELLTWALQILIYSQRGLEIWELRFLLQSVGISPRYLAGYQ